jgi:hypothetical protein
MILSKRSDCVNETRTGLWGFEQESSDHEKVVKPYNAKHFNSLSIQKTFLLSAGPRLEPSSGKKEIAFRFIFFLMTEKSDVFNG